MSVRPEFEPGVPLEPAELPAFIARLRAYAEASQLDRGIYQLLTRSADWLERARPLLERRGWWARIAR